MSFSVWDEHKMGRDGGRSSHVLIKRIEAQERGPTTHIVTIWGIFAYCYDARAVTKWA